MCVVILVGFMQRGRGDGLAYVVAWVIAVTAVAACGHEARLGLQCPHDEPSCADARTVAERDRPAPEPASTASGAGARAPRDAGAGSDADAEQPLAVDAGPSAATQPAVDAGGVDACRSVSMSYFACAAGQEMPGVPRLLAGRSYALRVYGDYTLDTTFQVRHVGASCVATEQQPLILAPGGGSVERCITPPEDVVLLITLMSGDPAYWTTGGLMAEVCDGCG